MDGQREGGWSDRQYIIGCLLILAFVTGMIVGGLWHEAKTIDWRCGEATYNIAGDDVYECVKP